MNSYQYAINQAISSFRSRDIADFKNLQSHWPGEHFGPFLRNQIFLKYRICKEIKQLI